MANGYKPQERIRALEVQVSDMSDEIREMRRDLAWIKRALYIGFGVLFAINALGGFRVEGLIKALTGDG